MSSLQASVQFNSALATNAQLRTMIDHLRQERSVFEGIQKKLQRVKLLQVQDMYIVYLHGDNSLATLWTCLFVSLYSAFTFRFLKPMSQ